MLGDRRVDEHDVERVAAGAGLGGLVDLEAAACCFSVASVAAARPAFSLADHLLERGGLVRLDLDEQHARP